jgi:hypothetical protein
MMLGVQAKPPHLNHGTGIGLQGCQIIKLRRIAGPKARAIRQMQKPATAQQLPARHVFDQHMLANRVKGIAVAPGSAAETQMPQSLRAADIGRVLRQPCHETALDQLHRLLPETCVNRAWKTTPRALGLNRTAVGHKPQPISQKGMPWTK